VTRVLAAVVVDEHLVVGAGLDRVGAEQRVTPPGGKRGGRQRGSRPVPDAGRASERPGQACHRIERAAELALPGDALLAPQAAQQLVLLRQLVPLLTRSHAEHRELAQLVALADHQLDAPARELVDGGVVLGHPERVKDRQHADASLEPDAAGGRRDGPKDHGYPGGQERPGVPLADGDRIETELLGLTGRGYRLLKPVSGADKPAGHRVLDVGQDVKKLKPHDRLQHNSYSFTSICGCGREQVDAVAGRVVDEQPADKPGERRTLPGC
jgi:hypothetical protein